MRYRDDSHTTYLSGTYVVTDAVTGAHIDGPNSWSRDVVDILSLMWDEPSGGSRVTKPCVHLRYAVDSLQSSRNVYHSGDLRNAPQPGLLFSNFHCPYSWMDAYQPSSDANLTGSYISVSGNTLDDISDCVFNAYNQYINSVRALDSSTSIAESGETPRLFELWMRRRAAPSNLVNGFLGYSFGWKPLLSDLRAVCKELRSFPKTVRKRLSAIGDGNVVRHYRFDLSSTIDDVNHVSLGGSDNGYPWGSYLENEVSVNKSRVVCVTIRAKVKPKLSGQGQDLLNQLGALGLVPSLATVWKITRLSFVVDWFYNVGGAIENLQGSLTNDITDVDVCVSDTRSREIACKCEDVSGANALTYGLIRQRYFSRQSASIPLLPQLRIPRRPMQYVLLGLLALTNTKRGQLVLRTLDGLPISKRVSAKIRASLDRLAPSNRNDIAKVYGVTRSIIRRKIFGFKK